MEEVELAILLLGGLVFAAWKGQTSMRGRFPGRPGLSAGTAASLFLGVIGALFLSALWFGSGIGLHSSEPSLSITNETSEDLYVFVDHDPLLTNDDARQRSAAYSSLAPNKLQYLYLDWHSNGVCVPEGRIPPEIVRSVTEEDPRGELTLLSDVETLYAFPSDFCTDEVKTRLYWTDDGLVERNPVRTLLVVLALVLSAPPLLGLGFDRLRAKKQPAIAT
ncbi:MAG: hypothetical protein HKN91_15240 [Acidimicrobiia bacterium]|nr:hypothetical protein [Acidimicrobiia bacterium]